MPRKKKTSSKKSSYQPASLSPPSTPTSQTNAQQQAPNVEEDKYKVPMVPFLIVIVSQWIWRYATNRAYITCLGTQDLVMSHEDYLTEEEFLELQKFVGGHPFLTEQDDSIALNPGNFAKTRGFVVRFNLQGLQQIRQHDSLIGLSNFVEYVKSREANTFVLNVLVCPPSDTYIVPNGEDSEEYEDDNEQNEDINDNEQDNGEGETEEEKPVFDFGESVVGIHLDDTAGLGPHWILPKLLDWSFLAHQVNVLYLSVPKDIVGGELDLWPNMGGRKPINGTIPRATVEPVENMMVEFRGDAFHRVRAFNSESDSQRISLVLEQYRIPSGHYDRTVEFEFVQGDDHRQYE